MQGCTPICFRNMISHGIICLPQVDKIFSLCRNQKVRLYGGFKGKIPTNSRIRFRIIPVLTIVLIVLVGKKELIH